MPSSFHGGARVSTGHISPQSVTVVGGGARDGRTEPEQGARASPMFSGCQSAIRDELSPNVLEQKPWGHVQAGSVPSKCVLSPLLEPSLWPQRGVTVQQEGLVWALTIHLGTSYIGPSQSAT